MDSVTQVLLGSAVAATISPKSVRKRAIVTGAILGTVPDLDVLIRYANDVDNFTYHRSFSHSLFVLPLLALFLMPIVRRFFPTLSLARLYIFILLPLVTHPLLDSLTAYGTQLLYPLDVTPTFIASILIIDPLYTIWLLLGVVLYLLSPRWRWVNVVGLIVSTLYLGLGFGMQQLAKRQLIASYPQTHTDQWFVGALTASPFCWRGVYRNDSEYTEVAFNVLNPDEKAIRQYAVIPDAKHPQVNDWQRLRWFNPNTVMRQRGGQLITSDLRMGEFGAYAFEFELAPDNQSKSLKLPMYDKTFWPSIQQNAAAARYADINSDPAFPKRKWSQFLRCLGGGL